MNPSPPSARHLLGTDVMSRDVLSMLLAATTHTFVVAITAAVTTAIFGTTVGAVSAYHGGVADALRLLPAPIFMVIVGRWSPHIGPVTFGAIYGLLQGLGGAAVVLRSQALKVMAKPFIAAARGGG